MVRKTRYAVTTGAILAAALILTACGSGSGNSAGDSSGATQPTSGATGESSAPSGGALHISAAEPSAGLDPATAVTQASKRVMELIYDTLIDYNEKNELIPMIAEKWALSDDKLSYVFTLRANAMFSDGNPITTDDVVYSLNRMQQSEALKAQLAGVTKIEATGDHEVTVTLDAPSRVFLNALATVGSAAILSQKAVDGNADYFTKPTATSGPWYLDDIVSHGSATLKANGHYWNAGYPKFATINYDFATDSTAMAAALETGTIDMTYNMVPADAVRLKASGAIDNHLAPSAGLIAWGLNKSHSPFDNKDVRQAVAYVVPREDAMQTCWSGIGPVSYGDLIFEGQNFYAKGEQRFQLDKDAAIQKAGQLLDSAGWVMGSDGVREAKGVTGVEDGTKLAFNVPYENSWAQARCNTEMLQQYLKPLGVAATPEAYDKASFYSDAGAGKFTMYHMGNNYATVDDYIGQTFTCEGSANAILTQYCNERVDELVNEARATDDVQKATDNYRQVQDIILDEQPVIPIGAQYAAIGTSPKLQGFYPRADASNRSLIYATLG